MKTVLFVILTAAITNNYVLVKFLGICPFLGVSKKLDQATGMSIAVIFVEVLATAVTWPIYHLLLAGKVDFTYMETVVFILVIAALVQLVEIVLKRYIPLRPGLFHGDGDFLGRSFPRRGRGAAQELRGSAHYAGFGFDRVAVVLRLLGRARPAVRRLRREMQ